MGHAPGRRPSAARRIVKLGGREAGGSARGATPSRYQCFSRRKEQNRVLEARGPHRARRRPARVQNCRINHRRIRPGDAHRAGRGAGRGDRTPPWAAWIAVDCAAAHGQRSIGPGAVGTDDVRGRDMQSRRPARVEHLERPRDQPEPGDSGSQRNAVVDLGGRGTGRQADEIFASAGESPMHHRPAYAEGGGIDQVSAHRLPCHRQRPVQRDIDRRATRHVREMKGSRTQLRQQHVGWLRFGRDGRRGELRAQPARRAREPPGNGRLHGRARLCLSGCKDLACTRCRDGRKGRSRCLGCHTPDAARVSVLTGR